MVCWNLTCNLTCEKECDEVRRRRKRGQEIMAKEQRKSDPVEGSWQDIQRRAGDLLYDEKYDKEG